MNPALVDAIDHLLAEGVAAEPRPLFPGAVCAVDDGESSVVRFCGEAFRYADGEGTLLPPELREQVHAYTRYDCASLTKLFTATTVMKLVERGLFDLDDRVATHLPEYRDADKLQVTVRQLLTHTSGLPAEIFVWRDFSDQRDRRAAVLTCALEAPPGSQFRYSCVGYLTLGLLAERLTGMTLDRLVTDLVTGPLRLRATGYRPLDQLEVTNRIAATEMRPISWSPQLSAKQAAAVGGEGSPDHRGVVHDENAASLNGIAGNAGIFADAADLIRFGRAFIDGLLGTSNQSGLGLTRAGVEAMVAPQLPPGLNAYQSGLGFRIDDVSFMGDLAGTSQAYGHTGFTGTSLVIDGARNLVVALLTNRVHPTRQWADLNDFRRRLHSVVAASYPAGAETTSGRLPVTGG